MTDEPQPQPCSGGGCLNTAVVTLPVCEHCARRILVRWRQSRELPTFSVPKPSPEETHV